MTDVRPATTLGELIGDWLPRQRWFAAKGGGRPVLESVGGLRLRRPAGPESGEQSEADVGVSVHFVAATVGAVRATYQVPLTYHRAERPELAHALVGLLDQGSGDGVQWVYDGPHDPAFVHAWLAMVASGAEALSDDGPAGGLAVGVLQPGTPPPTLERPARVLSGEQSNTSIIVGGGEDDTDLHGTNPHGTNPHDTDPHGTNPHGTNPHGTNPHGTNRNGGGRGEGPVILKVFRVLQSGPNPDVAVTSVLTATGCPNVPRLVGWVNGEWVDPDGGRAHGHLTSVSEFLPDSEDAWRIACVAVENGRPFTEQSRAIGAATAAVHDALARALPTSAATGATLGELADHLQQRLDWALDAVPALQPYADAARATVDAVRSLDRVPRLQRIHGDLHLGQVLDAGDRGWVLLDFEGEPLRPLSDRNRPDLAVRDIAGMLRSFDYAARHTIIGLDPADPRVAEAGAWAADCSLAFLEAYAAAGGQDFREHATLLRALELDKALYEAVYETRNRPAWVQIPFSAVTRLLAATPW